MFFTLAVTALLVVVVILAWIFGPTFGFTPAKAARFVLVGFFVAMFALVLIMGIVSSVIESRKTAGE